MSTFDLYISNKLRREYVGDFNTLESPIYLFHSEDLSAPDDELDYSRLEIFCKITWTAPLSETSKRTVFQITKRTLDGVVSWAFEKHELPNRMVTVAQTFCEQSSAFETSTKEVWGQAVAEFHAFSEESLFPKPGKSCESEVIQKEYTKKFLAVFMEKSGSSLSLYDSKITAQEFDTLEEAGQWCKRLNYQSHRYVVVYVRKENPSRFEESIEVAKIFSRFLRNDGL